MGTALDMMLLGLSQNKQRDKKLLVNLEERKKIHFNVLFCFISLLFSSQGVATDFLFCSVSLSQMVTLTYGNNSRKRTSTHIPRNKNTVTTFTCILHTFQNCIPNTRLNTAYKVTSILVPSNLPFV